MFEKIQIRGASQHNLKNVDVTIPRNQFVVVTGLSGSGKSSLAFDTLYAEGQRRYVESLSAYARQFLDRMQKPKVEHIEGLSPAIAIEQRTAGGTPRSTVATVTEIYDYLRLLYAHVGIPHCPHCGRKLESQSAEAIAKQLLALKPGRKMVILSPFVSGKKGEHRDVLDTIRNEGFVRARIDGKIVPLDGEDLPVLEKTKRHTVEAVVDRLITGKLEPSRLTDSVELALRHGSGTLTVLLDAPEGEEPEFREESFSENLACVHCGVSYGELLPRNFSFNSPYGACPHCNGLGIQQVMDPAKVVPDPSLSIKNGAIPGWRRGPRHLIIYYNLLLRKLAEWLKEPDMLTTPFEKLPEKVRRTILYGSGSEPLEFEYRMHGKKYRWSKPFEGVLDNLRRRMEETESDSVRERLSEYLSPQECPVCHGARLNPVSLAVTVGGLGLDKFNALSVEAAKEFVCGLKLEGEHAVIAGDILKEIRSRLTFLSDVGLNYLTLNRVSSTLSGGEAQRIRLATQLGCGLVGVLYILDEPSIGLHQRDNDRLLDTLEKLRDIGNTVLVVEHDLDTILAGGLCARPRPRSRCARRRTRRIRHAARNSVLSAFADRRLSGRAPENRAAGEAQSRQREIAENPRRRAEQPQKSRCRNSARDFHLRDRRLRLRQKFAHQRHSGPRAECEAGHSGPAPREAYGNRGARARGQGDRDRPEPDRRTPRSNPATYTDAFGGIRKLFSELPESKVRGYGPGRFSFNVKGGRCEECKGDGIKKIEMQFLSDVYVECSACGGRRFNKETLGVSYKKKNIADVLDMTVNQAVDFFSAIPSLARKFKTLQDVGLGYITLGQPATTLSGGEAQRVKLAAELARIPRGHTVYILDEPTTGLHLADIDQLLRVLYRLRDMGNTVIVIEHNLDVIKTADHIIDMGPEGGDNGGRVIASGTPEEVAKVKKSHTGQYLKKYLNAGK